MTQIRSNAGFTVALGVTLVKPDGLGVWRAGQKITPAELVGVSETTKQEWLRCGFAEISREEKEDVRVPVQPGANLTPIPTQGTDTARDLRDGSIGAVVVPSKVDVATSKWNFDPAALEGRTLDQLNSLVLEKDPNQQPFQVGEEAEAVAFLSRDFKPA